MRGQSKSALPFKGKRRWQKRVGKRTDQASRSPSRTIHRSGDQRAMCCPSCPSWGGACLTSLASCNAWVSRATSPRSCWFSCSMRLVSRPAFCSRVNSVLSETPTCQSKLSWLRFARAIRSPLAARTCVCNNCWMPVSSWWVRSASRRFSSATSSARSARAIARSALRTQRYVTSATIIYRPIG